MLKQVGPRGFIISIPYSLCNQGFYQLVEVHKINGMITDT